MIPSALQCHSSFAMPCEGRGVSSHKQEVALRTSFQSQKISRDVEKKNGRFNEPDSWRYLKINEYELRLNIRRRGISRRDKRTSILDS
jgi:hypothetical protein